MTWSLSGVDSLVLGPMIFPPRESPLTSLFVIAELKTDDTAITAVPYDQIKTGIGEPASCPLSLDLANVSYLV
jgi:hypothetical protein